jgi:hypothetical protein
VGDASWSRTWSVTGTGRASVEQHGYLGPEACVLAPLPDVEFERRLEPARVARVDERERVLHLETAQDRRHGRARKKCHVEELFRIGFFYFCFAALEALHALGAQPRHAREDGAGLRARDPKLLRHGAVIQNFQDEYPVASLLERSRGGPSARFDARFGVDLDLNQHVGVERVLERRRVIRVDRAPHGVRRSRGQRLAEELQCIKKSPHVRSERLCRSRNHRK